MNFIYYLLFWFLILESQTQIHFDLVKDTFS